MNLVHYAAANTNPDIMKFLLANGPDPNELDQWRRTPLMIAAMLGRLGNVQVLLEEFEKRQKRLGSSSSKSDQSDNDDEEDEGGDEYGDENGSDKINVDYVNCKDKSSWTALMYAAREGHTKVCSALIDAGANIEMKNSKCLVRFKF